MKYLLLCQMNPADVADATPEDEQATMGAMMAFNQRLIQAGVLLGAAQLDDPCDARCVSVRHDATETGAGCGLPGPIQVGGYYLVDVAGEPEALGWAAECPLARVGRIEVRRVVHSPL
jgi:hypothetical protein